MSSSPIKNMHIKADILFKYETKFHAEIALKSLKPDNMDFINSYVDDNSLICKLKGDSLRTILATADDLIFCEMMVEKIADFIEGEIK